LVASSAATLSACGGHQSTTSFDNLKPPRARTVLRAPGAQVQIQAPAAGSTQPRAFTVRVRVDGFHLVAGQTARRQGYGHLHFELDRGRYDQPRYAGANGRLALRLGVNGYYSPAYRPEITYRGVPPGAHTVSVELVNNDDTPTGVRASVRFRVR
jgi:hypothetical protein